MGGGGAITRQKRLGSGWTLLEWGINHGFTITMLTDGIRMRKVTAWIGYAETTSNNISISWLQTIPCGGIQARNDSGQIVEYTYL